MLKVLTGIDNNVLRTISHKVAKVDKTILKLMERMVETMKEENGVGLAAPQIGENIRIIVVKVFQPNGKSFTIVEMINPEIQWMSKEKEVDIEGCLSVPGKWGKVERSKEVKLSYLNKKSVQQKIDLSGINARIVQHEIDHLDGVLFVDKAIEMVELDDEKRVKI